jgi:hypothetical protein
MRRDKEDQGGEYEVERPIHSNPDEPFFDMFLWLGVRVLSSAGASKGRYICGDEHDETHSARYDSKVSNLFLLHSTRSNFLHITNRITHTLVGSPECSKTWKVP